MSELISLPPDLRPGLMPDQMVQSVVTEAFRVLLNTKHLYQHVDISVDAVSKQLRPTLRKLYPLEQHSDYQLSKTLHPLFGYWYPSVRSGQNAPVLPRETMIFDLPTVKPFCERCEEVQVQPFNPEPPTWGFLCVDMRRENEQVFSVGYLCQGCKDFRLTFMVMRKDLRLTLTGRSEIEKIQVPPYIPKDVARHYSSAVLAYNCNQVLPSLFMLRTLIEQYMQSFLGRGKYKDADQLCSAYNATLDDRFKSRFPSLPVIYGKLSVMPFTPQTKTRNCSSRKSGKYRSTSAQRDRGKKTAADSEGSNGRGTVSRCVHRNGEIGPRVTKLTGAKIRLHALRHYYASALIATGAASIVEIAKLMGHKDATITLKVYAHFLSRDDAPTAAFMAVSDGLFARA